MGEKGTQIAAERTFNLSCLHIPVTNLKRSVEFYVERLGFQLERGPSRNDQDSNALIRIGENSPTIFLHETNDVVRLQFQNGIRNFTHCVFEIGTRDIERLYSQLVQENIQVGERFDNPGCGKYFQVYDPDGHAILVCQDWNDR